MRILFLSAWYPDPPDNGSKMRIFNLLRGLSQQHEVSLIAFADQGPITPSPRIKALCSEIHIVRKRPYNPSSQRALLGFFSLTPRVIVDTYNPDMAIQIQRQLEDNPPDLILASQWQTAAYWQCFNERPAMFEEVEVGIYEAKIANAPTMLHRLRHRLPLLKLRYYLRELLPHFQVSTVVSKTEETYLRRLVPDYRNIEVIPNCIDLAEYQQISLEPDPNTMVFTGSLRYFANHDAMVWFLGEVYGRVKAQVVDVQLTIMGDHANMPLPPAEDVALTGLVEDVRPLVASSWVSVVPIRLGGGTRLKILEAMALRTPVVTTTKGAEGLEMEHDVHLLIGDTPETFADAVIRLLKDPSLRQRLTGNAYQLVREKYHWGVVMPHFLELIEHAAGNSTFVRPHPSINLYAP